MSARFLRWSSSEASRGALWRVWEEVRRLCPRCVLLGMGRAEELGLESESESESEGVDAGRWSDAWQAGGQAG